VKHHKLLVREVMLFHILFAKDKIAPIDTFADSSFEKKHSSN
jgi:hypothetical protein